MDRHMKVHRYEADFSDGSTARIDVDKALAGLDKASRADVEAVFSLQQMLLQKPDGVTASKLRYLGVIEA